MKRALLVGIDHYLHFGDLGGCVNDANALFPLLSRNDDNSVNMECRVLTGSDATTAITRPELLLNIDELLAPGAEFAFLFFAGHGAQVGSDVALATSDGTTDTPGVAFHEVLSRINASPVAEVTVILDCCFAGGASTITALNNGLANLRPGLTILTASRGDQVSMETPDGRGLFSSYLEGALDSGAADVLGHINVSGLYAYLSESFGAWDQRPTFKANIDRLHDIRMAHSRIELDVLHELTTWFPTAKSVLGLDPSYEPDADPHDVEHETIFGKLQDLRACRLVEPIDEKHMYFAAMNSTGCRLTPLGRHYWQLVHDGKL